eukprot:TRINITY_DN5776_c0_g1_i1.p1 TRINITY_DN5776_c0_g1~~TRINITY_DN5776_c0_g1_i1.p1  ORF type:complete len:351 (+),score=74.34 TRINITY_DN5776_c0_g1_i1:84-1136(+)
MASSGWTALYMPFSCCASSPSVLVDTTHELATDALLLTSGAAEKPNAEVPTAVLSNVETTVEENVNAEVRATPLPTLLRAPRTPQRKGVPAPLELEGGDAAQAEESSNFLMTPPKAPVLLLTPSTVCSSENGSSHDSAGDSELFEVSSPSVRAAHESLPDPSKMNMADSKSSLELLLPQLTLEDLCDIVLADDGLFQKYMREVQQFKATKMSPWTDCADSQVRTAKVMIPMPKDLPAAVRRLASIPDVAEASMAWRAVKADGGLDIVLHNCNTEVPFGDRFIVEDVCRLRSNPAGGVTLSKKVGLVWVKPLACSLTWLQKIIEQQVTSKAQASDPAFAKFVRGLSAAAAA